MQLIDLPSPSSSSTAREPRETTKHLKAITTSLAKAKKVVVLVGAGISTSAGIPDFRSKTGLYAPSDRSPSSPSTSKHLLTGPALFSASVYSSPSTRSAHWQSLSALHSMSEGAKPTPTHEFMTTLKGKGKLARVYSQNIDGLEVKAMGGLRLAREVASSATSSTGLDKPKKTKARMTVDGEVVQLHGSLGRVRCTVCEWTGDWDAAVNEAFANGETMDCPNCLDLAAIRLAAGKRTIPLLSFLRPALVLYDEPIPLPLSSLIDSSQRLDLPNADFALIMGTTLKIPGFKSLVKDFCKAVRRRKGVSVFVNMEKASKEWDGVFDYQIIGKTDDFTSRLLSDWKSSRPRDWEGQQTTLPFTALKLTHSTADAAKPTFPAPKPIVTPMASSPLSWPLPKSPLRATGRSPLSPLRTNAPLPSSLSKSPSRLLRSNSPLKSSNPFSSLRSPATSLPSSSSPSPGSKAALDDSDFPSPSSSSLSSISSVGYTSAPCLSPFTSPMSSRCSTPGSSPSSSASSSSVSRSRKRSYCVQGLGEGFIPKGGRPYVLIPPSPTKRRRMI